MRFAPPSTRFDRFALAGVLLAGTAAACGLALGLFARFEGLGAAPLAVDEYFIVRSTQNVLHHGWPVFDCGGIYSRGLLLQYLAALAHLLGVPLEVAPRLISAVSSVIALPAAFLIGRRVGGTSVALLAVAILAASVWETEIARFGRMYAPFQAVFLWYVVFFLKRTVDEDQRAAWAMMTLTVVSTLFWEGGVFLALANFLPVFLRARSPGVSKREWLDLLKFIPVLLAAYWFVTSDFRYFGTDTALPLDYVPAAANSPGGVVSGAPWLWPGIRAHPLWLVWSIAPWVLSAVAVRTLWRGPQSPWAKAGFMATLLAAIGQQFLAAAALLLLTRLCRYATRQELTSAAARWLYLAMASWLLFWSGIAWLSWSRPLGVAWWKAALALVFPLVSTPNLIDQVLHPWAAAVPALTAVLVVLIAGAVVRVLRSDESGVSAERAVLVLSCCMLLAASATHTPRHETRYVFFLFPLLVILALSTLASWLTRAAGRRYALATLLTTPLCVAAFMVTEDFKPSYLLQIDSPANMLNEDLSPARRAHLVLRADTRALARWLDQHATREGDVVVNAFQSLDYYVRTIDFFYVDRNDFNYEAYACRLGTVDRWSNRPLLQSVPALGAVIAAHPTTFLVTYSSRLPPLLAQLSAYRPSVQWQHGDLAVVVFSGAPHALAPLSPAVGAFRRCSI
jgi:hypothetical protein